MKKSIEYIILGAFLLCTNLITAQNVEEFERLAQSTMTFLEIDVGARPIGMGSAFTCMDNDVVSLFWNPAGIASVKGGALSINNTRWIADMNQYALAVAYGLENIGTFGLSFMIMDNGAIERTIPSRDFTSHPEGFYVDGTYNVQQWVLGLTYARQITDQFLIGGQVKYVYENLGETDIADPSYNPETEMYGYEKVENEKNREGVLAFDFGTIYYFGYKDLRIGMSLRNFSRTVQYAFESFSLPLTLTVAVAMDVFSPLSNLEDHKLQVSVMTVSPYDGGERVHIGGEYIFKNILALRTGYRTNTTNGSFSAGFGLMSGAFTSLNFSLDYAYSSADEAFGSIHRFSFGFEL
jgi:hypothetical protein